MAFPDLMEHFYCEEGDFTDWFYSNKYRKERTRVSRVLHCMNYYDQRENHWFQFVDIQYNIEAANKRHLKEPDDLLKLIMESKEQPYDLKIRITNAGRAYLGYVAQSFEFISCLNDEKRPLLCCIPTVETLKEMELEDLSCLKIIQSTLEEVNAYISESRKVENPYTLYKRNVSDTGQQFAERLVNYSKGFLINFCQCLNLFISEDDEVLDKKKELVNRILDDAETLNYR